MDWEESCSSQDIATNSNTMKISEIVLHREKFKPIPTIFSRDVKQRFKNGQIKVDGEIVKEDIDLNIVTLNDPHHVMMWESVKSNIVDGGKFIFDLIKIDEIFKLQLMIFGLEDIKQSNIKNDLTEILDNFFIIRISKKDIFVIKKN